MNQVVDDYGNLINTAQLKETQSGGAVPIGSQWDLGGTGALTPAKLRSILRGQGDLKSIVRLGRDIEEQDPHIYGEFAKRRRKILTRDWDVVVPENVTSAKASKAADFVRGWLKSLNEFEDIVYDQTEAISHLVACHELVYGTLDGVPVPVQFHWRDQSYLRLMRVDGPGAQAMSANRTDLRFDDGSPNGQPLWPGGWLIHVHKAKSGYLDRAGMPRILAAYFMIKHHCTMQNLPRWMEVYGIPPRIGKYDPNHIDAKGKQALWQAIRHMGQDAGGIIPNTMMIELLEAASGNTQAFIDCARMVDQYASKAILGRDIVAGGGGGLNGGSGQNEANNADVADDLNIADCKQLARTITQDLIWPVVQYFGISDMRECPQFRFDTSEAVDTKAFAEGLQAAQKAGFKIKRSWAYERAQIPVPEDGDELLDAPEPPAPPPTPGAPTAPGSTNTPSPGHGAEPGKPGASGSDPAGLQNAAPDKTAQLTLLLAALAARGQPQRPPQRDALDDAVDAMLGGWQPMLDDLLAPVQKAIANAVAKGESLTSLQARLPELLADMDITALTEHIARGQFAANLAGQAGLLDPSNG